MTTKCRNIGIRRCSAANISAVMDKYAQIEELLEFGEQWQFMFDREKSPLLAADN
jgi:hypothetical protein